MNDSNPKKPRWYRITPDRFLIALLPVLGLLYLSERFRWFPFNEHKGWTVLIAVAVVGVAVVLLLLWCGISLVFRRRFQFSIRSLLLFVLVVAIACSWLSVEIRKAERQRLAVEAIRQAGGAVTYDCLPPSTHLSTQPPPPTLLGKLLGDDFVYHVTVCLQRGAGDAELEHVTELTELAALFVSGSCTDADLEHVSGLTQLQVLDLDHTQVTDAGLEKLKGLTNLEWLHVQDTRVTDEGVKRLKEALPDYEIVH